MTFDEFAAGLWTDYRARRIRGMAQGQDGRSSEQTQRGLPASRDVAWVQNHATMGEPDRWVAARNSCSRTDQGGD